MENAPTSVFLDGLPVEAGSFYVIARGYLDFARLHTFPSPWRILCLAHQNRRSIGVMTCLDFPSPS
jgi:hypothetical protein